jgi:hypothetical protein
MSYNRTARRNLELPLMKTFHCSSCEQLVFFENDRCLNCGQSLAYLPDRSVMAALQPDANGLWRPDGDVPIEHYRLCANYREHNVCNWAVPESDPNPLCRSCRLTRVIPDLTHTDHAVWYRLEAAKRRLIYSLLSLRLPLSPQDSVTPRGVSFSFLADTQTANGDSQRVLTGHDNGLITINIAEADDLRREQQRLRNHEPYRTLLGHFRHEIGHYYWDRLIAGTADLEPFRALFGDERADYDAALKRHYAEGPPAGWERSFISAYATTHPWEDWAESWAHFMHITDTLETAGAVGLSLRPRRADEPSLPRAPDCVDSVVASFDAMITQWLPLTYVLNNLSRGLGLPDSYPFVLCPTVVDKLRFIHDTVVKHAFEPANAPAVGPLPPREVTALSARRQGDYLASGPSPQGTRANGA